MPINNVSKYLVQPTKMRKFVTSLNKGGVLLPVILLEAAVDGGRTYQAYKRGGYTEARERASEEVTAGVFWLFGVKAFNALGDKIGKKFFKIENPKFSLAKDAVRTPFENMIRDKNLEKQRKFLIGFKFAKITAAIALAWGLLGFVLPKINQKITKILMNKSKKHQNNNTQNNAQPLIMSGISMDKFINLTKPHNNDKPAFKGINLNTFATITNNLENHDIYKLLATDTGVFTGRAYNARNNDERVEIIVRDVGSIYFYLRCKDDVINLLSKYDGFGGKLSKLDPQTAMAVHNTLTKQLMRHIDNKKTTFDIDTVRKLVLGTDPKGVEEKLAKFEFKQGDVIALDDFVKMAEKAGVKVDKALLSKAREMSKLQPERMLTDLGYNKVGSLLTKQQVRDVLSDSVVSRPSFIKKIMKEAFNGSLNDPYTFIPVKTAEAMRMNIDGYVQAILEYAEKNNIKEITPEVLLKINKKNFVKNAIHIGAGLGVAALFLSTIIPKFQYWITKYRTGKDEFPGVKNEK